MKKNNFFIIFPSLSFKAYKFIVTWTERIMQKFGIQLAFFYLFGTLITIITVKKRIYGPTAPSACGICGSWKSTPKDPPLSAATFKKRS